MMKRILHAAQLGATLFVPATHKHLEGIVTGIKFPQLRSVVIDTEDGITASELERGLQCIASVLHHLPKRQSYCFLRPRNPKILEQILCLNGIESLDGFVLPKFGLDNASAYLEMMGHHRFMPSIEGEELFDVTKLVQLKAILLPYREQIIAIRFGAEDMMRQLGLRRECGELLYDRCAPAQVIANVLMTFKPAGFEVAAPVYRCYEDLEGFEAEVTRDLAEGFMSKTIIHPHQIEPVERLYRVDARVFAEAKALLEHDAAVMALQGSMGERATQRRWAQSVVIREEIYGVIATHESTVEE